MAYQKKNQAKTKAVAKPTIPNEPGHPSNKAVLECEGYSPQARQASETYPLGSGPQPRRATPQRADPEWTKRERSPRRATEPEGRSARSMRAVDNAIEHRSKGTWVLLFSCAVLCTRTAAPFLTTDGNHHDASFATSDSPLQALPPVESDPPQTLLGARRDAYTRNVAFSSHGHRDTHDLALDETIAGTPFASSSKAGASPLAAIDGDASTAWRGADGAPSWTWTLPFHRVVHLGLLRAYFGDSSLRGVPSALRWEMQPPVQGRCESSEAHWQTIPDASLDDRNPNTFLYGPTEVHSQKQAFFANIDVCALRLSVEATDGDTGPVLRELHILEGATSLTQQPGVRISTNPGWPAVLGSEQTGVLDGRYGSFWAGEAGSGPWVLTIHLAKPHIVDRMALVLGFDAVTVSHEHSPGRTFSGSYLPTRYLVETSPDDDPSHFIGLPEAANPPIFHGQPLPVRRRLVHFTAPRPVQNIRLTIHEATGMWGESQQDSPLQTAPVVRDIELFAADDMHPVVKEPLFLSVDANPSALTHRLKGGEAYADGLHARQVYHRLRRYLMGMDTDSRWPTDATRPRTAETGRFLEVIEGDDPLLAKPLLEAISPPPVVLLSGSFNWEFDTYTGPSLRKPEHWRWDVLATAEADHGMGQLANAVHDRIAPFFGFCGGAQILALLEATPQQEGQESLKNTSTKRELLDSILIRNENTPVRGSLTRQDPYERAWWYDPPRYDESRPNVIFQPDSPLFDIFSTSSSRSSSRELPMLHGDAVRTSAFSGPLAPFSIDAWSNFCRPWVSSEGPEPSWRSSKDPTLNCVRIPQVFHSRNSNAFPIVGFQFHPEQRDLRRLAPGSPPEARGDAMSLFANAMDLALESYLRLYWPDA